MINNPWYVWLAIIGIISFACLLVYLKVIGYTIG
jgi:hypothetical protein